MMGRPEMIGRWDARFPPVAPGGAIPRQPEQLRLTACATLSVTYLVASLVRGESV